jgi:hypothetical protein
LRDKTNQNIHNWERTTKNRSRTNLPARGEEEKGADEVTTLRIQRRIQRKEKEEGFKDESWDKMSLGTRWFLEQDGSWSSRSKITLKLFEY